MRKPQFINNKIYHICNRGVEKRKIFLDDKDRFRFIHDIFEFNDSNSVQNVLYYFNSNTMKTMEVQPPYYLRERKKPRKLLVEILIFVLMPNHFHLVLKQKQENGIVKFMQKLGTGYTMYFNQKYERVGGLFQGRFKAVLVEKEPHFIHLPYYIHLNPLELKFPDWEYKKMKNSKKMIKFLENYKWSSFPDYIGKKNFPSVTSREFFLNFFGGSEQYKKETAEWVDNADLKSIKDVILE